MKELGNNIRKLRKSRDMTQEELASLLGISKIHLCSIETGKKDPSLRLLEKIADSLNVDPSFLVTKDENYFAVQSILSRADLPSIKLQILSIISDLENKPK